MNGQDKPKALLFTLTAFLLLFYMAIIMYIFFGIIHIDMLHNFVLGMVFEIIGFVFLFVLFLGNAISNPIKTGYFIPLVIVTIIYTILLDLLNILAIVTIVTPIFALLHFVLLFVYCLISIPMYIMGKR